MNQAKQTTIKRHFFLVAAGTIVVLTLLSMIAPFDSEAPAMPADAIHQPMQKVETCLKCHANDGTAAKPMKHQPRPNCSFCHVRR
jgi:hypothetical protein